MDTAAIKKFATAARAKLLEQMEQRAFELGITREKSEKFSCAGRFVSIRGSLVDREKREKLIRRIQARGFGHVMEEMAYTWFNRFIALRFLEVNGYLPGGIRILSAQEPERIEPEIFRCIPLVKEGLNLDLQKIFKLQDDGDGEGLFRYLIVVQCNALHKIFPFMFEPLEDYSELLFPRNLLVEESVIRQMITTIDEDSWREVEIIGWLYQYYSSELYTKIVGMNKGNVTKEELPFATQLFTPKWIVQYMTENSLGKLWHDAHPDSPLVDDWEYYLWRRPHTCHLSADIEPENIKVLDPACGSGHILVYAFDLLYQIYLSRGYQSRSIPRLILRNNLYGLDIDGRAVQLANFALAMKAVAHDSTLLTAGEPLTMNIHEYVDSCGLTAEAVDLIAGEKDEKRELERLIEEFANAKQFGSLSIVSPIDFGKYLARIEALDPTLLDLGEQAYLAELQEGLVPLLQQGKLLSAKYHGVITNPPYHNKYNSVLRGFMNKHYNDYKGDLYSAFIYRCSQMTVKNGCAALMTPFTWMFIASHEKLRRFILNNQSISSLIQLEYSGFEGAAVPICAFVMQNRRVDTVGEYIRLADFRGAEQQPLKTREAVKKAEVDYRYSFDSTDFASIPGMPLAYWATPRAIGLFAELPPLSDYAYLQPGLQTSNNKRFLRLWHEINWHKFDRDSASNEEAKSRGFKWFPYNKGGEFRKWYGNQDYVVNWYNDGQEIKEYVNEKYPYLKGNIDYVIKDRGYYFREGITWSFVSSSHFGVRYTPPGFIFDVGGSSLFPKGEQLSYILAFLCSKLSHQFLNYLNPTLNFQVGNIASLPIKVSEGHKGQVDQLVQECIAISQVEWDSFEESWNFRRHPLLVHKRGPFIKDAFERWQEFAEKQFRRLKANEKELNRIFIEIYGLQNEFTPELVDRDVTIRRAERERDIKSFVSYAVGCMFGRYSLDEEGLAFAGGEFKPDRYKSFTVSNDNILPVLADRYFENDIVIRFVEFVKAAFGESELEENLEYIGDSIINRRASESARGAIRRYFLQDFYKDHVRAYKKRPIYWLFRSKTGSFSALVYLHRYDQDTVSRIRTDYLLKLQDKLAAEDSALRQLLSADLARWERNRVIARLQKIDKEMIELRKYDEIIHPLADQRSELDLDDGVVVNYGKFGEALARI